MPEVVKRCLLCGSERSTLFDRREDRGRQVENRLCRDCGLVFQSPRMTAEEADVFYATEYRRLYQDKEGPSAQDMALQRARAASLQKYLQRYVRQVTDVLEIGASTGFLLLALREIYRCSVMGIEPGNAYRQFASRQGLRMAASIDEIEMGSFDLIIMSHVLEHLHDPAGYLVNLRERLLSPDGWLLVEVPNLYCHECFEVAHLTSFSAHTLKQVVQRAGFEVFRLQRHGRPRSYVVAHYITLLARPARRIFRLRGEHHVALKRRVGVGYRQMWASIRPGLVWRGL